MTSVEAIVGIFQGLKPKEKQEVATRLGVATQPDHRTPCEIKGHRYKKAIEREPMWYGFVPGYIIYVCEGCGQSHRVDTGK